MLLLKEKVAFVTGATSGIGREIAKIFASHGAHVVILGTSSERAEETLKQVIESRVSEDQKFEIALLDVSQKQDVDTEFSRLLNAYGKVDILVNSAGITKDGLFMKMSENDWDRVIDVNLKSVYNTCQSVIRAMIKARTGKIINVSSIIGLIGNAGQVNYAASKAGIIGLTKALAQEVASRGICVNCLAPGFIQTPMTEVLTSEQKEAILKKIPLNKMGSPEDIAKAALFLASNWSDYITGQVLTVDGGMVM
ncbi:MAG: 3-oxoacyl-[acyl-carrier-protein] reductase [Rhabdochlamydiaceae bacterium]